MFRSTVARVDGADTFLYSPDCNSPDYFAIPEGNSQVWGKWQSFFNKLPAEKELVIEVVFEGKPEIATTRLFGSLDGWTRAQITLSKIVAIKDVTKTSKGVRANSNAPTPEIERIRSVETVMRIFFDSLHAPGNAEEHVLDLLSDDFNFTDLSGKTVTKDQYAALTAPWAELSLGIKESGMSYRQRAKTDDTVIWRGTFELVFKNGPPKTYHCDVTLVFRNNELWIRQATMIPGE